MRLLCVCERQILEKCLLTRDGETERKIRSICVEDSRREREREGGVRQREREYERESMRERV